MIVFCGARRHVGVVRQLRDAEVELGVLLDVAVGGGAAGEHRALAAVELGVTFGRATRVDEQALLRPFEQIVRCRSNSGLSTARRAFRLAKPLFSVANSVLCHAEKLSMCTQLAQLDVNGHDEAFDALTFAAAAANSLQVSGAFSTPAFFNASCCSRKPWSSC